MDKKETKKNARLMRLIIFLFIVVVACNQGKRKAGPNLLDYDSVSRAITDSPQIARGFWDSISLQLPLSDAQMLKYTIMDSFDFKISSMYRNVYSADITEGWGMYGDSVYSNRNFRMAILEYRDGVCLKKYLLVFDSKGERNLSYIQIKEGCDSDGDNSPYSSQDYRIVSDSLFETMDFNDPGAEDSTDKYLTTIVTKWKINRDGMIDSIPGKLVTKEPRETPEN